MQACRARLIGLLLMVFTMVFPLHSTAQTDSLSHDPMRFYGQISQILLNTKQASAHNKAQLLLNRLDPIYQSGSFAPSLQQAIWQLTNHLRERKVRTYPFLYDYLYALTLLGESKLSGSDLMAWHRYADELVTNKKLKAFLDFMKFTKNLMEHQQLYKRASSSWTFDNKTFHIHYDSVFLIQFDSLSLKKASRYDSTIIRKTKGIFYFENKKWQGKGGSLSWTRFKNIGNQRTASLSRYTFFLNSNTLTIDSVMLHENSWLKKDIAGRLTDRVFSGRINTHTPYPHFVSYDNQLRIDSLFPDIQYRGALEFKGNQLFGIQQKGVHPVFLFQRNHKNVLKLRAEQFKISPSKIESGHVELLLPLEKDSIYHPDLQLRYTVNNRQLVLYSMASGNTQIPFADSYHQMDLYVPSLFWQMNTDSLIFKKIRGVNSNLQANFESTRFFSNKDFYILQGIDELNPLYVIDNFTKTYGTMVVSAAALAGYIQKPIDQAIAMLINLSNHGFVVYNDEQEKAVVKNRLRYFLDAKARRTDFDVIHFTSEETRKANASLNLTNLNLNIYGVPRIFISDSQHVYIYPYRKQIAIHKNRDFSFDGKVSAGLFDIYARQSTFVYDSFMINLNHVDSLTFSVIKRDTIRKLKKIIRVKNSLRKLNGRLYVDLPFNKSGLIDAPKFPVFVSESESYVYFNRAGIQDSTLVPERFYYRIDPFTFDSLMAFNTNSLSFKGELYSDSLFPPISQPLHVMPDYSLGFVYQTPPSGLPLYAGLANFNDTIRLSNKGFTGSGKLSYLTTSSYAPRFIFYPDSLVATNAYHFVGKADSLQYNFPLVKADSILLTLDATTNHMKIESLNRKGIALYTNSHLMGMLNLNPSQMTGRGHFFFDRSEIISNHIDFRYQDLAAKPSTFIFKSANLHDTTFYAENYLAQIDFKNHLGAFHQLDGKASMTFPLNTYRSSLDQAQWMMDQNQLILSSSKGTMRTQFDTMSLAHQVHFNQDGSRFTALNPKQKSLRFYADQAIYNMDQTTIDISGVPLIKVADAAVIPDNHAVSILPGGQLAPIRNATLISDTLQLLHKIYQADLQILSKEKLTGKGIIDYVDINGTPQPITMNDIFVRNGKTIAKGDVSPDDVFFLSPQYFFAGKVIMRSDHPLLRFRGGYQLNEGCVDNTNNWISFNQELDPMHISFHLGQSSKTADSLSAYMGLAYSAFGNDFYPLVFQAKKKKVDEILLSATGELRYDTKAEAYQLGSAERLNKHKLKDNFIQLDNKHCILSGDGILNLNLGTHLFKTKAIGQVKHYIVPDSTTFDIVLMLNFHFDEHALELMADSIRFFPVKSVNIGKGLYPMAISKLLDKQTAGLLINTLSLYGQAKKMPEALKSTLTFTDLHLVWDKPSHSFISTGPIGLGFVGNASINKYVDGVMQIVKSRSGSRIQFLLRHKRQWYFFSYANGVLQAVSSDDLFNTSIENQKDEKRIINPNSMTDYYEYVISTRQKSINFIRAMKRMGRLK
jgi:hypothetical protein